MDNSRPFLEVQGLSKSFGSLQVFSSLDLSISRGEYVAIMGASGSGKTTLLQLIGLLDRPDAGRIAVDGQDYSQLSARTRDQFRNQRIGFVFQFHELLPEFTAEENVALPAMIAGDSLKRALNKAQELLAALSLSQRAKHKPHQLSGGERQRIAVARALINQPALLLADEPSGSLDSRHKDVLHNLLDEVKHTFGQTILVVTHDTSLAQRADRVLCLEGGKLAE